MGNYCEFRMKGCILLEKYLPSGSRRPSCLYPDRMSTVGGENRCPLVVIKTEYDRGETRGGMISMLIRDPRVNANVPQIDE